MQLGVWDTIFLLLTIIPVARMFSTIFMKLVVRAGTINEEKWAGKATAGFGTVTGLMALGRAVGGAFGHHGGARPSLTGSAQPTASRSHLGPSDGALSSLGGAGLGGGARSGPYGDPAGAVAASEGASPPGWQTTASGLVVPGGSSPGQAAEGSDGARTDPPGRTVFEEMVDDHGQARAAGGKVGMGAGLVAGALTGESLAVMGAGAILGIAGSMAGSTIHTVGRMTKGVAREMREGQDLSGALQRVTGDATVHQAAARAVTAVVTAPLGRGVQRHASNAAAWTAGRIGRIGGHVGQTDSRIRGR